MLPDIAAVGAACVFRGVIMFKFWPPSFWVPQPLIKAIGSEDEMLQEAAAGCVRNIRLMVKAYMEGKLFN